MTSGAKTKIVGFTESAYNTTPGTPDGLLLAVQNFNVNGTRGRDTDPTLSGFRGQVRSIEGRTNVGGPSLVTAAPQTIGWWLKHLLGAPTTTGSGPYTHTFSLANALPAGMLFEVDYGSGIAAPGRYVRYSGCRINQAVLTLPNQGFPTFSFDILGANFDATPTTPLDATPTDAGHSGFSAKQISLVFDGGSLVVPLETQAITIGNDLDADRFTVGNQGVRADLPEGFLLVSGQGSAFFSSASLINKLLSDTDVALVATLSKGDGGGTAGNEQLKLTIPNLVLEANTAPIDGPRGLKLPFNFTTHRTTGEHGISAELKSPLATIP